MAKIPYPRIEEMPPKIREFYEKIKANSPYILNVNLMMAHSAAAARELVRLGNRLLTQADLNPRFRELAIIRVSQLCGSRYEWAQHVPIALKAGLSLEQIEKMATWRDSDLFTESDKVVLAFTEEVVRDSRPKEETFRKAAQFLDETGLVELTISIGYWSMIAKFLKTFEIDLEEATLSEYGHLLPKNGHA